MKYLTYWERLQDEKRPIVLYGTGNGADKILDACADYGINVSGVFASDGFVRDRIFRDMKVLSYAETVACLGADIVILPAFGTTLPEVMEKFRELDRNHDVIIPEVPLYGGGIFDARYLEDNYKRLEWVYGHLSDDHSRELFKNTVLFRMTGKLSYLGLCEAPRDTLASIEGMDGVRVALDGGAFKGDSASDMIASLPSLERIIACEPDPNTFKKLSAFAESDATRGMLEPVCVALSDHRGVSECVSSGSRGSGISGRNRRAKINEVKLDTVDNILGEGSVDYIKLDVEGEEASAIRGMKRTLLREHPIVSVSLYHKTGDIMDLPEMLYSVLGECKTYLRRPECIPMWDLNMYLVPLSRLK